MPLDKRYALNDICDYRALAMALVDKCTLTLPSLYDGERNQPWNIIPVFGGPPPDEQNIAWHGRDNYDFLKPEVDDPVVLTGAFLLLLCFSLLFLRCRCTYNSLCDFTTLQKNGTAVRTCRKFRVCLVQTLMGWVTWIRSSGKFNYYKVAWHGVLSLCCHCTVICPLPQCFQPFAKHAHIDFCCFIVASAVSATRLMSCKSCFVDRRLGRAPTTA